MTSRNKSFYDNEKWVRLRKQVLIRDKYLDRYQMRYGKFRNADIVHHIFPLKEYPEYAFEMWNLISVSRATHNMFHDRNTDELTEIGMEVLRRICKKRNMEVPEKYKKKEKTHKIKYTEWY